ncbi:SDR family oxidoreductase [Flavobacterium zepuense]|uniref:SDR family oxidoreductase n=1 Tax=Flavobacterium zepuense TaxID=2593302 RepID=A0A552VAR7_9FLAO|nr:SDR family oxidoreductase [Flavobacterium zepuense]TRW27566.1 SDR family oxidoreductase [Flavobacterium zepuense]
MQKTIFITGASSGLGKAAALHFQAMGWKVIATMRTPEKEHDLKKLENVTVLKLDVSDPAEINTVAAEVIKSFSVDVVLNNAGYGLIGVLEAINDSQITRQIDTNLLGVIRLTKAFIPYFREHKKGMFINVSSMLGLFGYPTCSVYAATKFALDGFSESLAYELAHFGVQVKIVAPGGIITDFAGRSLDGAQHEAYKTLENKVAEGYSLENIKNFASSADIAATIYEAATDGTDQLRYVAGKDATTIYSKRQEIGAEAHYKSIKEMFVY